jgi:glutathione transport system ATP-binding protein
MSEETKTLKVNGQEIPEEAVNYELNRLVQFYSQHMAPEKIKPHVLGLLRKVGLGDEHHDRYPHEFSGGQRQRICIARALGLSPKMIIADEAVSALDVTIQAQVINLFMELQQELGLSLLFISHDMAVVERISHRVAVMYLGRIVEIGPRSAVFEDPQHSYTRRLLGAVPIADPTAKRPPRKLMADEIPSALKPVSYVPAKLEYRDLGDGHFVAAE